jgi:hypothetical protein
MISYIPWALALLVACASPSVAQDDEETPRLIDASTMQGAELHDQPAAAPQNSTESFRSNLNKFNAPKFSKVGRGGGGGGSGKGGAAKGNISWTVYPSIKEMEHARSHGILRFTGPNQGISVGFVITSPNAYGWCATGESPASPTDDACTYKITVSAKPGGAPAGPLCDAGTANSRGNALRFGGKAAAKLFGPAKMCPLPVGTAYCNITAGGFAHPEQPAKRCGGLLSHPMMQKY